MKFIASQTGRVAINGGTHVLSIVKGTEYDLDDHHVEELRQHGFVDDDKPKAAHPATENKMARPATDNKLTLKPKS